MNGKRKQHTAEFRFKVALEALKGLKTVSELTSIYEVHPTLINRWKKELHEGGRTIFGSPKRKGCETDIPMPQGFMYRVAIMDWYRRSVLSWRLSNTLEGSFCLEALEEALELGKPSIFNSDQGVQFTTLEFTGRLEAEGIAVSYDGRGRARDNVFVERLWRSVKYEDVYIKD